MRKTDEESIYTAIEIFKAYCKTHKSCKHCELYIDKTCILDKPPEYLEAEEIIHALRG